MWGRCNRSARVSFAPHFITEGATWRAFHDGLFAFKLETRIIALTEAAVSVAGQKMADLAEAHGLVGFSIAAARDIEIKASIRSFQHIDFERAILCPQIKELHKAGKRRLPFRLARCKGLAFGNSGLPDCSI